ncbi:MAG: cytochrome d ubiquinol oxidase subunit II [Bacteroidetes bacterium]|nr:cytochrome d ubiquinol oxidase subunit II [Bacteroidota bacterium]
MFENLSMLCLQQYWWVLNSILGALLVFLMFVQGGQTLLGQIGKSDDERNLLVNSLGRKWEFTFTTLVTFGGAMFASFPLFYSTSFGGAYWVWIIILFSFVIQAVSYEFRRKPNNFLGTKTYDAFLFINGSLGVILIAAAVSTFFTGSQFSVNEYNQSQWENPLLGLEAAFNITNLALGLAVLFLARILGAMYFINNINHEEIEKRSRKQIMWNAIPFLIFFLFFVFSIITKDGFNYDPQTKVVAMESFKYLNNLLAMPIVLVIFLIGVVLVLLGIFVSAFKTSKKGIWFAGFGTFFTVFALLLTAAFNHTAFYPSTFDLQSSLTIENASSSHYTLTAMSYVSLFIPVVLVYIYWAWKVIDKKQIDISEIKNDDHSY